MNHEITFNIGNQEITASYDDWEVLFEKLEGIFGMNAVEDNNNPERIDQLDCEIEYDLDINKN